LRLQPWFASGERHPLNIDRSAVRSSGSRSAHKEQTDTGVAGNEATCQITCRTPTSMACGFAAAAGGSDRWRIDTRRKLHCQFKHEQSEGRFMGACHVAF